MRDGGLFSSPQREEDKEKVTESRVKKSFHRVSPKKYYILYRLQGSKLPSDTQRLYRFSGRRFALLQWHCYPLMLFFSHCMFFFQTFFVMETESPGCFLLRTDSSTVPLRLQFLYNTVSEKHSCLNKKPIANSLDWFRPSLDLDQMPMNWPQ